MHFLEELKNVVYSERESHSFRPEIQIVAFGLLVCLIAWIVSDIQLFGHKSESIFDIWTLTHITTGAVVSYVVIILRKANLHHPIMMLLLLSFGWEVLEHYLELSDIGAISNWFAGQESLLNRLVADQIAVVIGFFIIKRYPILLFPMLLMAAFILGIHLYVGDSMFLYK